MLPLLWKKALLLATAGLLGLYSLLTATTADSLHSLPALDHLSTLGKDKPRVAILEPTPYHSGESAHIRGFQCAGCRSRHRLPLCSCPVDDSAGHPVTLAFPPMSSRPPRSLTFLPAAQLSQLCL